MSSIEQLDFFTRSDDLPAARRAAAVTVRQEGGLTTLRPGTHRHATLRAYAAAFPAELTATEAGAIATPTHDRVTGGARRTYDLSKMELVVRGRRGFLITEKGRAALGILDRGETVSL